MRRTYEELVYSKLISYNFPPSNSNSKVPIKQSWILLVDLASCFFLVVFIKIAFVWKQATSGVEEPFERLQHAAGAARNQLRRHRDDDLDLYNLRKYRQLLRKFPPEISAFLEGQAHRCLVYPGDQEDFWRLLRKIILSCE